MRHCTMTEGNHSSPKEITIYTKQICMGRKADVTDSSPASVQVSTHTEICSLAIKRKA